MLDKAPGKRKLDPRGIRCTFLGYDEPSRSYRVWIPSRQKVTTTRDIRFINSDVNMENSKESTSSTLNQDQDSNRKSYQYLPFSRFTQIMITIRNRETNYRETKLRQKKMRTNATTSPKLRGEVVTDRENFLQGDEVAHGSYINPHEEEAFYPGQAVRKMISLRILQN